MYKLQLLVSGVSCGIMVILSGLSDACVKVNSAGDKYNVDGSGSFLGCGYNAAVRSATLLFRDLTDQEIDDASSMPGGGYIDSQKAAEEAADVAVNVFQDDNGTIIIVDDDGEVYEV